ncbi:MAG TPA: M28 family metallopeptidase [Candidatus Limnocylindrales bacterium]|nr:M28 family metallopeptidase [Candidatus Limnocylindrales bacterium]
MPKMKMFLAGAIGLWLTLSAATVPACGQVDNIPVPPPDPLIVEALKAVSAQRIQQTIEKLVSFETRHTLSSDVPASSGKGINAAAEWIRSEFEAYSKACGGCLEVKTDEFTQDPASRIPKPTKLTNVYAILRGSDPANASRMFLVTGHYDSRNTETNDATGASPGANDDGSGTAVSLECARVLSQHRFPATIVFVAVAGEEQGLYGSAHIAKMAKAQGWDLEAVLNNDIVGGDRTPGSTTQDRRTVRVFSEGIPATAAEAELKLIRALGGENDGASRQLARCIAGVSKAYLPAKEFHPLVVFRRDRYLRGGDHISFNEQGFAAVRFTEYRENYDHQHQNVRTENGIEYGDLPKFVDYDYIANVARVNAATLASLASAPAPPAKVRVLTKALQNDSTLVWEASPGGLATGYLVLWRDTGAPDWEHAQAVANVTQATVPMSKDNVVFAVQAMDAKGHRSLPVTPAPER